MAWKCQTPIHPKAEAGVHCQAVRTVMTYIRGRQVVILRSFWTVLPYALQCKQFPGEVKAISATEWPRSKMGAELGNS